jgi:hypothetical protein
MLFGMSIHRTVKLKMTILMINGRHKKFIIYTLTANVTCRIKHFYIRPDGALKKTKYRPKINKIHFYESQNCRVARAVCFYISNLRFKGGL